MSFVRSKNYIIESIVIDYRYDVNIYFEQNFGAPHKLKICDKNIDKPFVIWDRVKLLEGSPFYYKDGNSTDNNCRSQEWRAFYKMLCLYFEVNVVNPFRSRASMTKPYQHLYAEKAGLRFPNSIISNRKKYIYKFLDNNMNIVYKTLSDAKVLVEDNGDLNRFSLMTMEVEYLDIYNSNNSEINKSPLFLQKNINKKFELRVVYVAGNFFSFYINSQKHEYYKIDWRRGNQTLEFSPYKIPDKIEFKINKFMNSIGLLTGSIDLIVDDCDNYWSLECNQDGQWVWLDDIVNGKIAKCFAEMFYKMINQQCHVG